MEDSGIIEGNDPDDTNEETTMGAQALRAVFSAVTHDYSTSALHDPGLDIPVRIIDLAEKGLSDMKPISGDTLLRPYKGLGPAAENAAMRIAGPYLGDGEIDRGEFVKMICEQLPKMNPDIQHINPAPRIVERAATMLKNLDIEDQHGRLAEGVAKTSVLAGAISMQTSEATAEASSSPNKDRQKAKAESVLAAEAEETTMGVQALRSVFSAVTHDYSTSALHDPGLDIPVRIIDLAEKGLSDMKPISGDTLLRPYKGLGPAAENAAMRIAGPYLGDGKIDRGEFVKMICENLPKVNPDMQHINPDPRIVERAAEMLKNLDIEDQDGRLAEGVAKTSVLVGAISMQTSEATVEADSSNNANWQVMEAVPEAASEETAEPAAPAQRPAPGMTPGF